MNFKKIVTFAAILILVAVSLTCVAEKTDAAAETHEFSEGAFTYEVISEEKKTARLIEFDSDSYDEDDLVIPDFANDDATGKKYSVTALGKELVTFKTFSGSLVIGKNVVSIEADCFFGTQFNYENASDVKLTLPDSVESVGNNAFYNCNFTEIEFNKNVKVLGNCAFCYNRISGLLTIPDKVNYLGASCFEGTGITSLSFNKILKIIEKGAFANCEKLESVSIPSNIEYIGMNAFGGTPMLKTVNFSEGLKIIGPSAFSSCPLESIKLPNSLIKIEGGAFSYCVSLKYVEFGKNLAAIDAMCFQNCASLEKIVFHSGPVNMDTHSFYIPDSPTIVEVYSPGNWAEVYFSDGVVNENTEFAFHDNGIKNSDNIPNAAIVLIAFAIAIITIGGIAIGSMKK